MGNKINDPALYPATVPEATDRVLGVDVSNTANDANGEVVSFTVQSIADLADYTVTEEDVTQHEAALSITESQISDLGDYLETVSNDDWLGVDLAIANGGTGASSASAARNNLGLTIGSDVLAHDANLQSFVDEFTFPTSDGNANQVLASDGSAGLGFITPGARLVNSYIPSAAANLDIELSGAAVLHRLVFRHVLPATDDVALAMRFSIDGGSTFISTSNYAFDYVSTLVSSNSAGTEAFLNLGAGNVATEGFCGVVDIWLGNGSARNRIDFYGSYRHNGGSLRRTSGTCELTSTTTAATDLRIFFTSGNIASGAIFHYIIPTGA